MPVRVANKTIASQAVTYRIVAQIIAEVQANCAVFTKVSTHEHGRPANIAFVFFVLIVGSSVTYGLPKLKIIEA
jgi:hypothetical protein